MIEGLLLADATVAGQVGTRVYDSAPRQAATMPYIVVHEKQGDAPSQISGESAGLTETEFDVDVFDDVREDAYLLSEDIRLALEGYRANDAGGDFVHSFVARGTPMVTLDKQRDASDQHRWRVRRSFRAYHYEAVS